MTTAAAVERGRRSEAAGVDFVRVRRKLDARILEAIEEDVLVLDSRSI